VIGVRPEAGLVVVDLGQVELGDDGHAARCYSRVGNRARGLFNAFYLERTEVTPAMPVTRNLDAIV
jgi:hypothetical protein